MDEHIAKYQKINQVPKENNSINRKEENKEKFEKFEIDESNLNSRNERNISNMGSINYDNEGININSNQQIRSRNQPDKNFLDKMKQAYTDFMTNKQVRAVICPYDDSSEGCQICYKICAGISCFMLLFSLYLIFKFQ